MSNHLNQFTDRTAHLKQEGAYAVLFQAQSLEAKGRDIIHLEIGQPDFQTFPNIGIKGIEAIATGQTRYNPPAGVPALRAAIAQDSGTRRNITIQPEQIVVGPGAKPLIYFPVMALVEPGDEVIYPDPGFPSYSAIIQLAGGVPIPVPLLEENSFSFDLAVFDRKIGPKTRLIILNSPSNPTGCIIPPDDLAHILRAAEQHDCWILSDEIYMRLTYGEEPALSIAALPGAQQRTIIMDGFSKTYAMTGWRLGFGIMPVPLAEKVGLLLTHSLGCTATFTQLAGVEALTGPQEPVEAVRVEYQRRRDLIVGGLNAIPGVTCRSPQGAFYVFPNIKSFGLSSDELADYLLNQAGVAVLPGTAFGQNGEGYLRLCYANSFERIQQALERIGEALALL
jgi:aspartate/methionine/tyrosine aminotransferase